MDDRRYNMPRVRTWTPWWVRPYLFCAGILAAFGWVRIDDKSIIRFMFAYTQMKIGDGRWQTLAEVETKHQARRPEGLTA